MGGTLTITPGAVRISWWATVHVLVLHDDLVEILLLGRAEVLPHRNHRDFATGRQHQGVPGLEGPLPPSTASGC